MIAHALWEDWTTTALKAIVTILNLAATIQKGITKMISWTVISLISISRKKQCTTENRFQETLQVRHISLMITIPCMWVIIIRVILPARVTVLKAAVG